MRKWIFIVGCLGMATSGLAEIQEKPIKLEEQSSEGFSEKNQKADQIYFPPATEPYKPVDVPAKQAVKEIPKSYVYESRPVDPPVQQTVSSPAPFSSLPNSSFTPGMPIGRDAIEQAATTCESQLTQLWQRKSISDPVRRAQFQKSMGEAKYRCDQIKELALKFKQADADLNTFYFNVQQAEAAAN